VEPLVDLAATGSLLVELCAIVKMELLVLPYRSRNVRDIYIVKQFVHDSRGVSVAPLSDSAMELSTEVRAITGLKVPDALVVGSAVASGCDAIVGNDRRFGRLNDRENLRLMSIAGGRHALPRYVHLDDYLDGN
jgi:predicted nucleic acid-binding protein